MSKLAPSFYLHGTDPAEQNRLLRMNEFINAAALELLTLRPDDRVLEVGSGLGLFARDMARVSGRPVVCVEFDDSQIYRSLELAEAAGESSLLEVRQGDVRELPLRADEWGEFDVVHCRFVLEHVERPQESIADMKRALRPGGRLVLADDDHDLLRLWPSIPAVDELWRAYIRAFQDHGNDPYVGRKLIAMMRLAGLEPVRNEFIFFGGCAGSDRWAAVTSNLVHILAGARAEILASSAITGALFDEVLESLREWIGRPDSALWYQICWAESIRADA